MATPIRDGMGDNVTHNLGSLLQRLAGPLLLAFALALQRGDGGRADAAVLVVLQSAGDGELAFAAARLALAAAGRLGIAFALAALGRLFLGDLGARGCRCLAGAVLPLGAGLFRRLGLLGLDTGPFRDVPRNVSKT